MSKLTPDKDFLLQETQETNPMNEMNVEIN